MTEFANVTVSKKANIYFDGKVTSRTLIFADGSKKTLGIMLPGEYTFNTEAKELMEILGGEAFERLHVVVAAFRMSGDEVVGEKLFQPVLLIGGVEALYHQLKGIEQGKNGTRGVGVHGNIRTAAVADGETYLRGVVAEQRQHVT